MAFFKDFLSTFSGDSSEKGKQFERFVKWFLVNDPTWKTQVEQVWHWDEYPNRWGKDLGIDLVFKHKNGDLWAVQAKCYAETTSITKAHVDSFISESDSKTFSGRLLIGTTDSLADNAKKVCDRQNVTRFLLADFESSPIEFPDHYDDLTRAEPSKPPEPRAHQLEAIRAVQEGFKDTDRGQLIMACGTGKTFTTLWIKEALDAESTLILLPSLGLLSQTRQEWTRAANKPFEVLCVCSDDSVGKRGDDEIYESVAQLPFPVTSDPQRIEAFLELQKPKVIFSTYQSSPLVAEAQAANTGIEFDLIVADEAHRCAGVVGDGFSSVLNGQRLRGKKRLFATATPRTYSKQIKSAAEGRGIEVVGMDDEAVFGKPLYTLSFGEAIERKLLTDYRVVIVGVDDAMLASWIENREIVRTDTGIQTDAKSLAATVGLLKAIKDYDLHRVISFHSRVKGAEAFAEEIHEVQKWLPQEVRLAGKLNSDYVSGAMPTDKRRQKLSQLKNVNIGEVALLSNARCLSEGVDVPSLDGVAFIDPKNSQIDIIQAVGRAIRLSTNKTAGTIVLPVFLEKGGTAEEVIERSNFNQIWHVLLALKAHDEAFANELDQLRMERGRQAKNLKVEGLAKIFFDLPSKFGKDLVSKIRSVLLENVTSSWMEFFGALTAFYKAEGHTTVPIGFKLLGGKDLGVWVAHQRARRSLLSNQRVTLLESIPGWKWVVWDSLWKDGFEHLKSYVELNGTANVPQKYIAKDGFRLGAWVSSQRGRQAKMSADQISELEALPDWKWAIAKSPWNVSYERVLALVEEAGSIHDLRDTRALAWLKKQRTSQSRLSAVQQGQMEKLQGWTWNILDEKWMLNVNAYTEFTKLNGHGNIHRSFTASSGVKPYLWLQSCRRRRASLSAERLAQLERLPFWSWNQLEASWETGLEQLKNFKLTYGHYQVPQKHVTISGFKLGAWVSNLKNRRSKQSPERIKLIESLPDWTWLTAAEQSESMGWEFLSSYVKEFGHSRVPQNYETACGFRLGSWVAKKRQLKSKLGLEDLKALEKLPGWTWNMSETLFKEMQEELILYVQAYGNACPKVDYVTENGISLGGWVRRQGQRYEKMTLLEREWFEQLPGWKWR